MCVFLIPELVHYPLSLIVAQLAHVKHVINVYSLPLSLVHTLLQSGQFEWDIQGSEQLWIGKWILYTKSFGTVS